MKRKKIFAVCLAIVLSLTFVTHAFAASGSFNYSGNAYKNFKTTSYVTKDSSTWSFFRCTLSHLSYTFSNYDYSNVRPISYPGSTQFSDPVQMLAGDVEIFFPNANSHSIDKARLQFFNVDHSLNGAMDNLMHADGSCTIAY